MNDSLKFLVDHAKKIDLKEARSDSSAIKIGTEDFQILIGNSYGDGVMYYCVLDGEGFPKIDTPFNYVTQIYGKFDIYDYDCGETIAETVGEKGSEYAVYNFSTEDGYDDLTDEEYSGHGYVIFLKIK